MTSSPGSEGVGDLKITDNKILKLLVWYPGVTTYVIKNFPFEYKLTQQKYMDVDTRAKPGTLLVLLIKVEKYDKKCVLEIFFFEKVFQYCQIYPSFGDLEF